MTIYLHDIPLNAAKEQLEKAIRAAGYWGILAKEEIPLDENALWRVLAEPVWAKISSPHYHASAMDGFAVSSSDTEGAMPTAPLTLSYGDQAAYIDTGDPLPSWADAVIPIENIEPLDKNGNQTDDSRKPHTLRIRAAVTPWNHVRSMGEDMVATQLVLPAGHTLRPIDLGAIAGCGHDRVQVSRRPRVAVIPTGTELVQVGQPVRPGDIIEYNSIVLAAQVNAWGGQATRFPITPDDFDVIRNQVIAAADDHDLVLLNAGSSAGSEDFSANVVASLGELLVHGVAVRPGHPVILGMIDLDKRSNDPPKTNHQTPNHPKQTRKVPIIGVPGYPVSAAMTGEIFVEPLISNWLGKQPTQPNTVNATLTRKMTSPPGDDDFVRVAVGRVGERLLAAPLARGAGVITSLVRADGIAIIPSGSQGLPAGADVEVRLYRSPEEIEKTIFAIGSHDITLDILSQFLASYDRRLASANVGSLGGLVALRRQEAHLAGSHLLDPSSGDYNLSYIDQYLPGIPVTVIALVGRQQGLLVPKGNPKNIQSLSDITRQDISFVNRQRGAGTRVLLDYHLDLLDINSESIRGYQEQEYTHLAVAAAVASGKADCGLGIAAAAQALDLEFVSLFDERYDLVIPQQYFQSSLLKPVFKVLQSSAFRQAVQALPGYDISSMGEIIAVKENSQSLAQTINKKLPN
jgi:putative molybdopterin biosynthesis protein